MTALEVKVGSTITNGSVAVRVTKRGLRPGGWYGLHAALQQFGDGTGTKVFIPDHLLPGWRHVPFEWVDCPGGQEQERYVWGKGCRWLERETRPTVQRHWIADVP